MIVIKKKGSASLMRRYFLAGQCDTYARPADITQRCEEVLEKKKQTWRLAF